jgi:hypothetical protein|tara:strand:- start:373 stop:969 length:597 start_codon:yes stop_codon:yes gene_type:complete
MYKLFTDKAELFECDIKIEGASLSNSTARLVVETNDYSLMFNGSITSDGKCKVPIKKLKGLIDENNKGNIKLEVIAEDTFFTPWETTFEVQASKQVTVEIKSQSPKKPILETTGPKVKVTKIKQVKQNRKPAITEAEKRHILNIMKLLIHENVNIDNLSIKKDKLNKVIATYNQFKPINESSKSKVIDGVLTVLAKSK